MTEAIVAGITTTTMGRGDLEDFVFAGVRRGTTDVRPKLLYDINGHAISLFHSDGRYRDALQAADLVHADGQSVVFASRILCAQPIRERTATTDMLIDYAARAAREQVSFFLLGGDEATNVACAERLTEMFPDLKIAGRQHGFFSPAEEAAVLQKIERSGADILWVGLGKPLEQIFGLRARERLSCSWIITCGGCFNFATGHYRRAPRWMQRSGFEWFHRMITKPNKLLWRYLSTNPIATFWMLRDSR
ncbi:glycosyltransferase [Neorhizobium lilium]|uniref:Glycosyltransferase n=1 Tax=Neorhizobium lilium TaxID=2503024 RepID=A0A3S3VSF1_9HYPH|nr:WecB/TagA/CpsF family glycosyltransferase [Neorhizobium lilium]RWX80847.1 glycosyltransferase [Neorhizobium lilium]